MLLYFCWRDVGILYSRGAVIQRTIDVSPAFLKHDSAERKKCEHMQTVTQTCRRLDFFLKLLRTLCTKYIQEWKIKQKNIRITVCMRSHFFSPRNRTTKMRERRKLLFELQLLVSKEFHHLANCKQGSTLAESFHQSAPVMIGLSTCKPNLQ